MIENKNRLSCLRLSLRQCISYWLLLAASTFTPLGFTAEAPQVAPSDSQQASTKTTNKATYKTTNKITNKITIGIIIDDLGYLNQRDTRAVRLPGAVTLAFLPQTPHARTLAQLAHQLDKEVMLHLPMESMQGQALGPGGLTLDMTANQFAQQFKLDMESVPHVAGVNNHMGSLLTQHPGHMLWLMQELRKRDDLYFVDSYTTKTSIAQQLAAENWVPNLRRDVFLDHDRNPEKIRFHFQRLIKKARKNGSALAIGHPYPETMLVLEQELPKLQAQGITLVPVSQLVRQTVEESTSWQAYLSR